VAEGIRIEQLESSDKAEASKVLAQAFSGIRSPMSVTQPRIKRVLVSTLRRVLGRNIGMRAKLVLFSGLASFLTFGIRKDGKLVCVAVLSDAEEKPQRLPRLLSIALWLIGLLLLVFLPKQGYTMIHETNRKCRSAGSAKTTSGNPLGERFGYSGSSPAGRGITILCETLEGPDRERRKRSVDGKASPRSDSPVISRTEKGTSKITSRRPSGSWVCQSIVDTAADSQGNRGSFRCKVSSSPCLEDSSCLRLELPKAAAVE
jgi:hypothetical protein